MKITKGQLRRLIREAMTDEGRGCSECGAMEGDLDEGGMCGECAGMQSNMQMLPATLSPGRGPGGELDRTVSAGAYRNGGGRPSQKVFGF